ncbi:hypothetical protein F4824DRAFT_484828, partial [Ustulina deusta]
GFFFWGCFRLLYKALPPRLRPVEPPNTLTLPQYTHYPTILGALTCAVDIESIDSEGEDELYLDAIESACVGQKGVQTQLNMLTILAKAINNPDERQRACLEAMQLVSKAKNHRMLEELLKYVPLDSVTLGLSCRCGWVRAVQAVLRRSISINAIGEDTKTPIQVAVDSGHSDLIELLVANGVTLETIQNAGSPLNLYHLVAAGLESRAFSITRCEELVRKFLKFAERSQLTTTADEEFLGRSLMAACRIGSIEMASGLL